MSNKQNNNIINKLYSIEHLEVRDIGRAGNIIWIVFGDDVICKDYQGNQRFLPKYSLHLQCPFRALYKGNVITGDNDIFEPYCADNFANFNWQEGQNSLFDMQVKKIKNLLKDVVVNSVCISELGDIKIECSNSFVLETFVNTTSDNIEAWRFFENGKNLPHIVKTGRTLEMQ